MTEKHSPRPEDLNAEKLRQALSHFSPEELAHFLDKIGQLDQERDERERREYRNRPFPGLTDINRNLSEMVGDGSLTQAEANKWMTHYGGKAYV